MTYQSVVKFSEKLSESRFGSAIAMLIAFFLAGLSAWWATSVFGFGQLVLASLGIACSLALFKVIKTQEGLTLNEIAQSAVVVGLLGLCADEQMQVWKVSTHLVDVSTLSPLASSLFILIFFCMQCGAFAVRERGLNWIEVLALISAPYLFGWLLLLVAPVLPTEILAISSCLTSSSLLADLLARAGILVMFSLVIVGFLGVVIDRGWTASWSLAGLVCLTAIGCALTPQLANLPGFLNALGGPDGLPVVVQILVVILAAVVSQAGLWGQTYLITGFLMDALSGKGPTASLGRTHLMQGISRGAVYGGVFLTLIFGAKLLFGALGTLIASSPTTAGLLLGALLFPLAKTIVESFDGSSPFVVRLVRNYLDRFNYLRGIVVGLGISLSLQSGLPHSGPYSRAAAGFLIGGMAYAGISFLRDAFDVFKSHRFRFQHGRVYAVEVALGGVVGAAVGWYVEQGQLQVVLDKFLRYATVQESLPQKHIIYPLFSKWGALDLGAITGGARLLFNESLSGVIGWSLAAPLFSINLVLLTAILRRDKRPLKEFVTAAGFAKVITEALRVERWGLWMAPIIYSFLRMSGDPTWYNQDGAVRSIAATFMSIWADDGSFRAWSLWVFMSMLAYDWLRVIIWFDHMGLRVATLVNLSFIGGDLLDEKAARAMGHAGATRCIPEGLRRFATWMPLLIPFYIPRGGDWDYAWNTAETIFMANARNSISANTWLCGLFIGLGCAFSCIQVRKGPNYQTFYTSWTKRVFRLYNARYAVELDAAGRGWSRVTRSPETREEVDLTRRPESSLSLSGKTFYLVDRDALGRISEVWSIHSSPAPAANAKYSCSRLRHNSLHYECDYKELRTEATVVVSKSDPFERWDIRISNSSNLERKVELVSFRDLVLRLGGAYERHPNFNDLHIASCFVPSLRAVVASNRLLLGANRRPSKELYFHALGHLSAGVELLGYEDSRGAVIGAGTKRSPNGLADDFRALDDEGVLYPFDPGASLRIAVTIPPRSAVKVSFGEGWAKDAAEVAHLLRLHLKVADASGEAINESLRKHRVQKRHYAGVEAANDPSTLPWEFSRDGKQLAVREETPRPWSHPLANPEGYGVIANNEGAVFSFCGNAQQNAITPSVLGHQSGTVPGQAWHFWDVEKRKPLIRLPRRLERAVGVSSSNELRSEFGRGYVKYNTQGGTLGLETTLFVLPDKPIEVRMLKLRNHGAKDLKIRMTSCMQFALAEIAADSRGVLDVTWNDTLKAFIAINPNQQFKRGPVFVAPLVGVEKTETVYSRYVGRGRGVDKPVLAEHGVTDADCPDNGFRVAAFSSVFVIPKGKEVQLGLVMGQASSVVEARGWLDELRKIEALDQQFERTKSWWDNFLGVLRIETEDPTFDRLVNDWIPYQLVASRLWGRTGPQQRSGAFGFRDQLQDVIPLANIKPDMARAQILLHSAQQFLEGDTLQWWHRTWEGRTGLGARNQASDVMLWLPYVVLKYLESTGDRSILDVEVPYLEGRPIPEGTEGICFVPRVSREVSSVYGHCKKAIDRVLEKMGEHGVPLMGSGDWNDGLDAVGRHGKGESSWLGFFLHGVLRDFAQVAGELEGPSEEQRLHAAAEKLKEALAGTWRDGRFMRATNDIGEELIYDDALTSSWPIIAGAVDFARGEEALTSGLSALEKENIVLLLSPAFDERSRPYPGRISLYPPGVRENGGQYSHGTSWLVDAALRLAQMAEESGDTERAAEWRVRAGRLWHKISPLTHSGKENWQRYGAEPHQQPADVYYGPGYEGRGGWSWYTGSAGRMLTAAWALVGVEVRGGELFIADWAKAGRSWPRLKRVVFKGKEVKVAES